MSPRGPNSRRVLNQSTHVTVAKLYGLEGAPRALPSNYLRLVHADHRLGESISIALTADRRRDAGVHEAIRVPHREILGEFNRSSRRLNSEELRWEHRNVVGHIGRNVLRCGRRVVPRRDAVSIGVRFWAAIACGVSSEDAALAAGVSQPVGTRWFRENGGMPSISLATLSGRYLSFAEREEVAILHARHVRIRDIARRISRSPSTISRGATSQCCNPQWRT